jgi:hypothetical protein
VLNTYTSESLEQVAESLHQVGFSRIPVSFVGTQAGDFGNSRAEFLKPGHPPLPPDRFNTRGVRRRRLAKFIHIPSKGYLESIQPIWDQELGENVHSYFQSARLNPDQGGKQRKFAALLPEQTLNHFFRTTIGICSAVVPRRNPTQPEYVNGHLVQVIATPGQPGISSPPVLHRDGEWITFAFLVERRNVTGGENVIATLGSANREPRDVSPTDILERFTLENPWEGYVVDDQKVTHYVDSIFLDEVAAGCGWRTVLLIDFTPAIPDVAY